MFVDSGGPLDHLHEAVERDGLTVTHLLTTHSPPRSRGLRRRARRALRPPDRGKEPLETGGLSVHALETPGHSDDHLAFLVNDTVCFTADILFKDAVGGEPDAVPIRYSVMEVLMALAPEVRVLPGHTEETTIEAGMGETHS